MTCLRGRLTLLIAIAVLLPGWVLLLLSERERTARYSDQSLPIARPEGGRPAALESSPADRGPEGHFDNRPTVARVLPTLSVGASGADLLGSDDRAIQAGVDLLAGMGGGRLELRPGVFTIRNAISLRDKVDIAGSGERTILRKGPGVDVPLTQSADWFETAVVVERAGAFSPGDGIMIESRKPGTTGLGGLVVSQSTVTAVDGNIVYLNNRLEKDHRLHHFPRASNRFALLKGMNVENIRIENLVLDGSREENGFVDGNLAGAVYLKYCADITFTNVVAQNYNGDGFSAQVCANIRFEQCTANNNAMFGFHPGSGSPGAVLAGCRAEGNTEGIYFCWGVTGARVVDSHFSRNRDYGISIGYRDSGNRIENCVFEENGQVGVLFRKAEENFAGGNQNVIAGSTFRDNGPPSGGAGIAVEARNHALIFEGNTFVDSGAGRQTTGIWVHPEVQDLTLRDNRFENTKNDIDSRLTLRERAKELLGRP